MAANGTSLMLAFSVVVITAALANVAEGRSIGVNWGRLASQKLLPSMVVDMLMTNGIDKAKFFSVNDGVLSAFTNSNVELFVNVPNVEIVWVNSTDKAKVWVNKNIRLPIEQYNISIRYLGLTMEPFSKIELDKGDTSFLDNLPQTVKDLHGGLSANELADQIKVVMPHATDILKPVNKPSDGDFRIDLKEKMIEILKELNAIGSPFVFNIYPLHSCLEEMFPPEFGLFDKSHNISIQDGDLTYDNMFDLKYDTLVWALRNNGFGDMKIIIGQVGWPTDGHLAARNVTAKRFYDGLFNKIANDQGTPLQPGLPLDVYIHSLVDENQRATSRGPFDRHYGIYNFDGTPKFKIDFTLQGRDIYPESAKGISYLPQRWCVLDTNAAKGKDALVENNRKYACFLSDCTKLEPGATCGHLKSYDRVSYAFNIHFQQSNQDISGITEACTFDGLGKVVDIQPKIENCSFPVQILSTLFMNGMSNAEMGATLGQSATGQRIASPALGSLLIILPIILVFLL